MCEGTDYYMYIPSELDLYYVYAIQHEGSKVTPLNCVTVPNSLTTEDFDTLIAVLDDPHNETSPVDT